MLESGFYNLDSSAIWLKSIQIERTSIFVMIMYKDKRLSLISNSALRWESNNWIESWQYQSDRSLAWSYIISFPKNLEVRTTVPWSSKGEAGFMVSALWYQLEPFLDHVHIISRIYSYIECHEPLRLYSVHWTTNHATPGVGENDLC